MKLSAYAMAYAHKIGFDTAMRVGTFEGCPLYVCDFYPNREECPCIGLPQYVIIKDLKAVPLSLEDTMLILRERKKKRKKRQNK